MRWCLAAVAFLTLPCTAVLAIEAVPPRTVTISDPTGLDWNDELVHYRLEFPPHEQTGIAIARVECGGTTIASQVSDVTRYEDGSIRAMTVWLKADVPANSTVSYTITAGKPGVDAAGVTVKATPETIELTTRAPDRVGIRLLNGEKRFAWPIPAADAPGPIQALLLPSGRVTGRGRFEAPLKLLAYQAEVTARGPLFAEAKIRYQFDSGYWTFTARVVQGSPLVLIEEELDNGWNDQKADCVDCFYSFTLNGEQFQPTQGFFLGRVDKPEYKTLLDQIPQPEVSAVEPQAVCAGTCANGYSLRFAEERTDYGLIGWPCWSPRVGVGIRFVEPGKDAVGFVAVRTSAWRNPMALRFRVNRKGELAACLPLQVYEQDWPIDGYGRNSPNSTGKTLGVPATTARRSYGIMLSRAENEVDAKLGSLLRASAKAGAWPLDEIKDWIVDWPDPLATAPWTAQPAPQTQKLLEHLHLWMACKRAAGNFGLFSMHDYFIVSQWNSKGRFGLADLKENINDPRRVSADQRKQFRRQCAYLAYVMNSSEAFPWGAGCHLGNPNMSIMAMNTRVFAAALVKDHPMFKAWGEWTTAFAKEYVARFTRESGATYECPSYTLGVTMKQLCEANAVLLEAGIGDALSASRFKQSIAFAFNWLLPPDLRFHGKRTIMPIGNTSYQSVPPELAVPLVKYYQDRDPPLAGQVQWFANQTLPADKQITLVKDLVPKLGSKWTKDYGVVFRHGFQTPYETCFQMMAGNCLGHYEPTDHMVYTLYAKGQPIHLHFGNGYFPMFSRPWLRNGVAVDHRRAWSYERLFAKIDTAALLPPTEYARASLDIDELLPPCPEYPPDYGTPDTLPMEPIERLPLMTWRRQVLFVKDQDPKGPNYFVVRDSFDGKPIKPTEDNFWFLATGMARDRDVFHFEGQLPVDMDVFVNTPAGSQPESGEFRHVQQPYGRLSGDDLKYYPNGKRQEKQLFLRLKQPAGRGYFVVLYPRLKEIDPAATFTSLGENAVKVQTPLSDDYLLVSDFPVTLKADRAEVQGTAAAVRFYKDGTIVVANSEGPLTARVAGKTITGQGPLVVTIRQGRVTTKTYDDQATVTVK
jgi:hypothetical protein